MLKLKPADVTFSRLIRERANWTCERCGTKYEPPTRALHCSHFLGRGNHATRFDPRNADAFCYGCHQWMETRKGQEYRQWKEKRLGGAVLSELEAIGRKNIKFGKWEYARMNEILEERGLGEEQWPLMEE